MSPEIDEKAIRDSDPQVLTIKIAQAKATELLGHITESVILVTADQIVLINGEIREKPKDENECRAFLASYDDQPVEVINGVVVTNTLTGKQAVGNQIVHIKFKQIPASVIDSLIAAGDVFYCSGGLKAELPVMQAYIESIDGTAEDLQGVPVGLTKKLIKTVS